MNKLKNYSYYTKIVEDKSFQKDIIDVIDKFPDVQKKNTNVKAKMTDWYLMKEKGFNELSKHMLDFAEEVSEYRFKRASNFNFTVKEMWGICYESNEYTLPHDHWPFVWSVVYYINPPENCPNLVFPELNNYVEPKDGLLVLFPGWMVHEVPPSFFEGKRYVVSANITLTEKI